MTARKVKGPIVGRMATVERFVRGYPVGLPTGAHVEVTEVSKLRSGVRVQVRSTAGTLYWVDEADISPMGGAW